MVMVTGVVQIVAVVTGVVKLKQTRVLRVGASSSWLETKNLKPGWFGPAWRQSQKPSLAWLRLKQVSISKLSWARARGK